jgi:hypothetical protein
MSQTSWRELQDRLTGELSTLEDREFVVLGEPVTYAPGKGLFRKKPQPLPHRYVQFRCSADQVFGECVGAASFGGDYDLSPEQDARLREIGWFAPGGSPDLEWSYPNYQCRVPRDQAPRLAELGVEALQVLGLDPTDQLELTRGR